MVLPILNTSTKEFAEAKKQSVLVFGFYFGENIIMYTQTYTYILHFYIEKRILFDNYLGPDITFS